MEKLTVDVLNLKSKKCINTTAEKTSLKIT